MIEETLFQHFLQDFIYEINYDVCSPKRGPDLGMGKLGSCPGAFWKEKWYL